jgi:hypothetical protein
MAKTLKDLIQSTDLSELKGLFAFDKSNTVEQIIVKFNLWGRKYFSQYYQSKDAAFHKEIDINNIKLYVGEIDQFVNVAFRGASKTSRTKLFLAFCICNDLDKRRK